MESSTNFITDLPAVRLSFMHNTEVAKIPDRQWSDIPVYLNGLRQQLITSFKIPTDAEFPTSYWAQRGIAIIVWSKT